VTSEIILAVAQAVREDVLEELRPCTAAELDAVAALVSLIRLAAGPDTTRLAALRAAHRALLEPCARAGYARVCEGRT
jgi:hypothetical protein